MPGAGKLKDSHKLVKGVTRLEITPVANVKKWYVYMGVSKNSGTPKWMVKIMENPIRMDDLGVPLFLETPNITR